MGNGRGIGERRCFPAGLVLAAVILGSTPFGWAAAVVGVAGWLVSLLLEDRELKARRQRDKLEERLNKNVDNIERGSSQGPR